MRYKLYADRLINMLTSIHVGGRKHILWLQSNVYPLQVINNECQGYFEDKILESKVTSQVMWFEWFLNKKLSTYFQNSSDSIVITHFLDYGVPFYKESESEANNAPFVVYGETESVPPSTIEKEKPKPLYLKDESYLDSGASFHVSVPALNMDKQKFEPMLRYFIDRYKVAGKTYKIIYK